MRMNSGGWQTKSSAKRIARRLYRAPFFAKQDPRTPCVIHGMLPSGRKVELHHLDELGKENEAGWYFENLVPLCRDDNGEIEDNRKSGQPLRKSDNLFPASLLAKSLIWYEKGDFLLAYGCARLGSFLAWAPGRPGSRSTEADPNPTIELATNCLLYLRLVDPRYAANLAVDTLDRSILRWLETPWFETSLTDLTLFLLAVAIGAFHRDYGHRVFASAYFDLADRYAKLLYQPQSKADAYVRFQNHKLINEIGKLEAGRAATPNTDQTRRSLEDTEYGQALGGRMNLFYWALRELRSRAEPDAISEALTQVNLKSTNRKRKNATVENWRHGLPEITPVLVAEYLVVAADALSKQGRVNDARELIYDAARIFRDGHFGASWFPNATFVSSLHSKGGPEFVLPFKDPALLEQSCARSQSIGGATFVDLSKRLLSLMAEITRRRTRS